MNLFGSFLSKGRLAPRNTIGIASSGGRTSFGWSSLRIIYLFEHGYEWPE